MSILSIPLPSIQKLLKYKEFSEKRSKRPWLQNLDRRMGRMWIMRKYNILILIISTQNLHFGDDDAIFYVLIQEPVWVCVITTDMKSVVIHLLKYFSFRQTQTFSYFNKVTGPILPFVVLAFYKDFIGHQKCFRFKVINKRSKMVTKFKMAAILWKCILIQNTNNLPCRVKP